MIFKKTCLQSNSLRTSTRHAMGPVHLVSVLLQMGLNFCRCGAVHMTNMHQLSRLTNWASGRKTALLRLIATSKNHKILVLTNLFRTRTQAATFALTDRDRYNRIHKILQRTFVSITRKEVCNTTTINQNNSSMISSSSIRQTIRTLWPGRQEIFEITTILLTGTLST